MQFHENVSLPEVPIDRFTDTVLRWLDRVSPLPAHCDAHEAAADAGLRLSPCASVPVVGDVETEKEFCAYHWPKFERGQMAHLTR